MTVRNLSLLAFALVASGAAFPLAANQVDETEPIDISLKAAPLRETLQSFAAINGAELLMEEGIQGSVTIEIKKTPWPEVLDGICREHDLFCEMLSGDAPILRARRSDPEGDYPLPPGLAEPINLSLIDADLGQVFKSFAAISDVSFDVHEDVEGIVSLNIRKTPWSLVLTEICQLSGCRVLWGEDHVEIVAQDDVEKMPLVNLSLKSADARQTLSLLGEVAPILGDPNAELWIDPAITGTVTVDLVKVNYQQSLDLLCEQLGCDWVLDYGHPPVLKVLPRGAEETRPQTTRVKMGAAVKKLAYRFTVPGSSLREGTLALGWAAPIQVLESGGPFRVRLSWIPFSPELSVLLPLIERCENQQSSVSLLEPIVLPLQEEVDRQAEGVVFSLRAAQSDAPAPLAPVAKVETCGPARKGKIRVTVRRFVEAEAASARAERHFELENDLLVRPVEARRPLAALIALGGQLDGRQSLAFLQPAQKGGHVEVETLSLDLGDRVEKIVGTDGRPYELRIEYLDR